MPGPVNLSQIKAAHTAYLNSHEALVTFLRKYGPANSDMFDSVNLSRRLELAQGMVEMAFDGTTGCNGAATLAEYWRQVSAVVKAKISIKLDPIGSGPGSNTKAAANGAIVAGNNNNDDKGTCYRWRIGDCGRGGDCRYRHSDNTETSVADLHVEEPAPLAPEASEAAAPSASLASLPEAGNYVLELGDWCFDD